MNGSDSSIILDKEGHRPSAVGWLGRRSYCARPAPLCAVVAFTVFDVSDSSINCCNLKKENY